MIEIVQAELFENEAGNYWSCWLQITQDTESWMLPTTAPGIKSEGELQAHFDTREADLWRVAQAKQYTPDVFERVPQKKVLKAFALVVLDEINILRGAAGLAERTQEQIVSAIKGKLRE